MRQDTRPQSTNTHTKQYFENNDVSRIKLYTHQFNTYKSGDKEALMIVSLKKDGLIWKTETGATEM